MAEVDDNLAFWQALAEALRAGQTMVLDGLDADQWSPELRPLLWRLQAFNHPEVHGEAARLLEEAAKAERQLGHDWGSAHSLHLLALWTNLGGNRRRLRQYYSETLSHAKATKNYQGMALCLRTLGELALIAGDAERTLTAWRSARRLLGLAGRPETKALPAFE